MLRITSIILSFLVSFQFMAARGTFEYKNISLEDKIAQLLIVGFQGQEAGEDSWIKRAIEEYKVGGVILFTCNISSKEQTQTLIHQLKQSSENPLLIAIDQEGGLVSRLNERNGFEKFLSAEACGLQGVDCTFAQASKIAEYFSEIGANLNFAPVVDLKYAGNFIGDKGRCYSNDPTVVALHAKEFAEAHNHFKILWTLKHFPGHGNSKQDSHLGFVDITETWNEQEVKPYEILFSSIEVPVVMVAHVVHGDKDSHYPASLSQEWIQGYLRTKLGYTGVVVSDSLHMGAIANQYTLADTLILAVNAGNDLLLLAHAQNLSSDGIQKVISILVEAVQSGKVTQSRIDEAYTRVMKLKNKIQ